MSDLVDRQAAIDAMGKAEWAKERLRELPSAQPDVPDSNVVDLISREAISYALNTIKVSKNETWYSFYQKVLNELCKLPSAHPDIIRCENCIHSEHWYGDKSRCFLWYESGIGVFNDGFCSYAERKEG